ncbi:hypothetical protein GB937_005963 [Aspergillus fischeri]|nr:hypothetical protein GB937_005963 [Aspergillus fischeri]
MSNLIRAKRYILSIAKTGCLLSLTGLDIDREYRPIGVLLAAGLSGSAEYVEFSAHGKICQSCMSVSTVQATAASINHPDSASDTNAGPIAQTTIPYDDEFDLVCDL